jgi:SAM-dependent methyltransferase
MKTSSIPETTDLNKTHLSIASFAEALESTQQQIVKRGDLPHVSVQRQLDLLDQLCQFPFGRYLIERRGANGYWTDYLISYKHEKTLNEAEDFILNRSLIVLAHRDRFQIYQSYIQKQIQNGIAMASVPCGLMKDLLTLNFSDISSYKLVGVDIDPESIALSKEIANNLGILNVQFYEQDAWQMSFENEFNIITSSGLNVYESDPIKVLDLYKKFYKALKPGGSLVISVLTYPPGEDKETDWDLNKIPPEDLLMEKILYKDILNLHWRNFRSITDLACEFEEVGFTNIQVEFDRFRLFPTIIAQKPVDLNT